MQLVIISGRSGSGKSIALQALEDLGYYAIDNLPAMLLEFVGRRAAARRDACALRSPSASMPATFPMRWSAFPSLLDESAHPRTGRVPGGLPDHRCAHSTRALLPDPPTPSR